MLSQCLEGVVDCNHTINLLNPDNVSTGGVLSKNLVSKNCGSEIDDKSVEVLNVGCLYTIFWKCSWKACGKDAKILAKQILLGQRKMKENFLQEIQGSPMDVFCGEWCGVKVRNPVEREKGNNKYCTGTKSGTQKNMNSRRNQVSCV
jgi:hypothetical protein